MNNELDQTAQSEEPVFDGDKTVITSSVVPVEILGFSEMIDGKIDTGAVQTSLHATNINATGSQVEFTCGDGVYRVALYDTQEISSADGGANERYTIMVNLTINGINIPEQQINLNDRSNMPQMLLIGQDVIKAAGLVIDISEESDAESQKGPEDEEMVSGEVRTDTIAQLGDNTLAVAQADANTAKDGGATQDATLNVIRQKLADLLADVDRLIELNS